MVGGIFLAGAAGVVGRRLVPLLRHAGLPVFGTTRRADRAAALEEAGATPVVVDVFDAGRLSAVMAEIRPEIVIHQLTDLPSGLDPARMAEAIEANARIRREGTGNLVAAARAAGVRHIIAQSIAWAYAPGAAPHREGDPLDDDATGARAVTIAGVRALEDQVLQSPPIEGVVLRYGRFYGPGTGVADRPGAPAVHVDAAAQAALLAIDRASPGIFNIVEPDATVSSDKARHELGWSPDFRSGRR
ncbi:MAG: NAD(P)-dependent oxidoreductase [Xanthobacteraceae bacterium]|nr:NAD(P)-dependent oxidoreductase [Xanthobacteraceae bacterium]